MCGNVVNQVPMLTVCTSGTKFAIPHGKGSTVETSDDADIRESREYLLAELQFHWGTEHGGPYDICTDGSGWNARYWNAPARAVLRAGSAGELRQMIWADYFRRTGARHLAAVR